MRTAEDVLRELDSLRDRRYAGTIDTGEYRQQDELLWDELRAIDRAKKREQQDQLKRTEQQEQHERRQLRIARSQRRLERLLARPRRKTRAELRAWLDEFLKIDCANQPELRARQGRVESRLLQLGRRVPVTKWCPRLWTQEDRMLRRAKATGDAALVIQIAERFHKFVRPLYLSRHAKVVYGRGGQEEGRWSNKYYNTYKHGGVWIDYDNKMLWLEDYRQNHKHGLSLPDLRRVAFDGLEDGDLWGIGHSNECVERYALMDSGLLVSVGIGSLIK